MLSYKTKNALGIILIFVPVAGFLFSLNRQLINPVFIIPLIAGILCESILYRIFSMSVWLSLNTSFFAFSALTITYFPGSAASYISYILLGFCSGGFIFILPPNAIIGWFFFDKAKSIGSIISIGIILACAAAYFFTVNPALSVVVSFISMVISSLIIVKTPPNITVDIFLDGTKHNKKNRIKLSVFFFLISLSLTFAYRAGYTSAFGDFDESAALSENSFNIILTIISIALGPALSALFADKKGIYGGTVMLIFLSELSVMCMGFYSSSSIMGYIGNIAFGMAISSTLVICPLSVYYIMGSSSYNKNLGTISTFIPLGAAFLLPYGGLSSEELFSIQSVISILFILVVSFFTIFSAWKHRLVLLK